MTSPSLDGAAVVSNSDIHRFATSKSLSISTSVANDLILVFIAMEGGGNVTGVTSAHLTFTQRFQVQNATGGIDAELWWARASGTLSSESITVSFDGGEDGACVAIAAFQNVNATPFDGNGSLPASSTGGGSVGTSPTVSGISTTNADDLIFYFESGNGDPGPGSAPSGYTSIAQFVDFNAGGFSNLWWGYLSESSPQSGLSQVWGSGSSQDYVIVADAITNDGTSFTLDGAAGSYAITGQPAALLVLELEGAPGSYTITGQPAALVVSGIPARRKRRVVIVT